MSTPLRAAAVMCVLLAATGLDRSAWSQTATVAPHSPPANVVAAKAYSTLERYCAGCHQSGSGTGAAAAGFGNVLALDEIARDPRLVKPGLPDGSRIYNVALTQELHLDVLNDPAMPLPGAADVQALRDWITELPRRTPCRLEPLLQDPAVLVAAIARDLAALAPERARLTRFVSLAHLTASCASTVDLDRYAHELAAGAFVRSRSAGVETAESVFAPVDPQRLIWRVSLRALGWSPADWNARAAAAALHAPPEGVLPAGAAEAGGTRHLVVPADWLVHAIETSGGADRAPVSALARAWQRGGTMERLAAEAWQPVDAVRLVLAAAPPSLQVPARRLIAGEALGRHELARLAGLFTGKPVEATEQGGPLRIALWSDKRAYSAGDTATFFVSASRDCFLTLINVDRSGRATVLFPNELQPDNRIAAAREFQVPGPGAPYRFRFREPGREQIVAVCSQTQRAPEGIAHDFERLRFTVLGDWQLFLREPPEMKEARRDDAATDVPRPQQRRRRARGPEQKQETSAPTPDIQTRTAISIEIE